MLPILTLAHDSERFTVDGTHLGRAAHVTHAHITTMLFRLMLLPIEDYGRMNSTADNVRLVLEGGLLADMRPMSNSAPRLRGRAMRLALRSTALSPRTAIVA